MQKIVSKFGYFLLNTHILKAYVVATLIPGFIQKGLLSFLSVKPAKYFEFLHFIIK